MSIDGAIRFDGSCACGTVPAPAPFFGCHCCAPAGLFVSSHSKPNRFSRKLLLHFVGVVVQVTSRPLVIVSAPLPVPKLFFQPKPCSSRPAASGSGRHIATQGQRRGSCRSEWPPTISATVSSSFIAMRPKVSRMSFAAAIGSGLPSGPSGLT